MTLLSIMFTLIAITIGLKLFNRYIPMATPIKIILNWVVAAFVFFWILSIFGLTQNFKNLIHGIGGFLNQSIPTSTSKATNS